MARFAAVGSLVLSVVLAAPLAFAQDSEPSTTPPDQTDQTGQTGDGTINIVPGGAGSGHIASQPAGIDCTITHGNGDGTCTASFPAGTVVLLDATAEADSIFEGFRATPGCTDASKITVVADTNIYCQPGFQLTS
jgi:hypothetical protein